MTPEAPTQRARTAETGRLEAFSDGVLAIVITLLVLELHPPEGRGDLLDGLVEQWPGYLAYLASFGYVAVIWVNHHELFTRIRAVDPGLLWRNLLLLLTTSFLPYPTAVLGAAFQHGTRSDQAVALVFYCAVAALMAASWLLLFQHLCRHAWLLRSGADTAFCAAGRGRSLVGIAGYSVAAASAAWQPLVGLAVAAVLPVFYALTSGRSGRRSASGPSPIRTPEEFR